MIYYGDDAELNFDKIVDEVSGEIAEVFSGAVKHIPLCSVDGEGCLRGGLPSVVSPPMRRTPQPRDVLKG